MAPERISIPPGPTVIFAIVSKFLWLVLCRDAIPTKRTLHSFNRRAIYLFVFPVFLDVVETEGEDLDKDLKQDFRPGW